MGTQDIYNYRKVSDNLITAGQPTAEQLRDAAEEGFAAVINLATYHPEFSLPDEEALVRSLGMAYYAIPVVWANPTPEDFNAFDDLLHRLGDTKMLIHCQANYRVTAFYGLYAQKRLGWSEAEAEALRQQIWQGSTDQAWDPFIRKVREQL